MMVVKYWRCTCCKRSCQVIIHHTKKPPNCGCILNSDIGAIWEDVSGGTPMNEARKECYGDYTHLHSIGVVGGTQYGGKKMSEEKPKFEYKNTGIFYTWDEWEDQTVRDVSCCKCGNKFRTKIPRKIPTELWDVVCIHCFDDDYENG